jgi:acetyl-CoA acetyltransferase
MKNRNIVIAGYAETRVELKSGKSAYDLAGEAFSTLLDATGIPKREIDGLSVSAAMSEGANPFLAPYMCDGLGLSPTWLNLSGLGGASALGGVARAVSAVREGLCGAAVIISADAQSTDMRAKVGGYRTEYQQPVGVNMAPTLFGLLMSRYEHQFGLKFEALGKIAATQRSHAMLNDNACEKLKKSLTVEEYMQARMVSDPLRLVDSVMVCDGANALLVTTAENARRLGIKKMVYPVAYAELTNFNGDVACPDITVTGFSKVAPRVYQQAGVSPKQIRMFHPYDDFTIAVLMQLEDFGFCGKGEGSDYVLRTDLSYKGELPLNTSGGQLSAGQPGLAGGGLNLTEAVRQMFGDGGPRQVSDPRNALITGIGVIPYGRNWSVSSAMILEA